MSVSPLDLCTRRMCPGCDRPGTWLCGPCAGALARPVDHAPVAGIAALHCPWAYEGAARDLILALKLRGRRDAARPLVDGVIHAIRAAGSAASSVTWVPARRGDIRRRGFDHAEIIATGVAHGLGLERRGVLARRLVRPDQAGLSAPERHANLLGAFAARRCGGSVLLVDDLVTTGATARACAAALLTAGAARVELAVVCRA